MAMHNGHKVWYAVLIDNEDNDHGTGSYRNDSFNTHEIIWNHKLEIISEIKFPA